MIENLYTPNCIRTVSGRYINLREIDPKTWHIGDIAHALSNVQRFGGHLPIRYSVAHHSLGVLRFVPDQPREIRLQALMHDASEAFLGDMPSPIKQLLPDYQALEARVMEAMSERFGFPWPIHPAVKEGDRKMLEWEWESIMLQRATVAITDMEPAKTFLMHFNELSL